MVRVDRVASVCFVCVFSILFGFLVGFPMGKEEYSTWLRDRINRDGGQMIIIADPHEPECDPRSLSSMYLWRGALHGKRGEFTPTAIPKE
jgi:hypothetical protein